MRTLVVGASGNLGSHFVKSLFNTPHSLRLLLHRRSLPFKIKGHENISVYRADLEDPASLLGACSGIDCVIYLAGVLFRPRPASFLHRTNTLYLKNVVDAALSNGVRKFILISFPHVEEGTTPDSPARGLLEVYPTAIHGKTRLAAEKYLFQACEGQKMRPIVFRAGIIYGRGVKLIEAAHWLLKYRLLALWKKPTWVHLLALPDFLTLLKIGIERDDLFGIYNICDDRPLLLQDFLDGLAAQWGYPKPWRLPAFSFYLAAVLSEVVATILKTPSPLTRDIIKMGMTSVVADTSRMKRELLPDLAYPTFREGCSLL
ncbi:MAG: NAD(P)-dependent oxidoreductase [Candidatus Manganitrophaceae bacterium]